jgi:DNA repair exonuclease SbcCD nuclease subunit
MKMLIIGDVHIKHKDINRSTLLINSLIKILQETKPDAAVLLGDVFDGHNVVHADCMALFCKFLDKTAYVPKYHILGNHEMPDSVTIFPEIHALVPFMHHRDTLSPGYYGDLPAYTPITTPQTKSIKGIRFGFIPYIPPNTVFNLSLAKIVNDSPNKPKIVFCHQEFLGCKLNGNKPSEKGDRLPGSVPETESFNIDIISGHIHGNQRIGNIWYPGTPVQQDFGEDINKGVYLIEVEEDRPSYTVLEKIEIKEVPKLITHPLSVEEAVSFQVKEDGNIHRIAIYGTKSEIASFRATEKFEEILTMGKVKLVPIKEDAIEKTEARSGRDFGSIFLSYLQKEDLGELYADIFEKH